MTKEGLERQDDRPRKVPLQERNPAGTKGTDAGKAHRDYVLPVSLQMILCAYVRSTKEQPAAVSPCPTSGSAIRDCPLFLSPISPISLFLFCQARRNYPRRSKWRERSRNGGERRGNRVGSHFRRGKCDATAYLHRKKIATPFGAEDEKRGRSSFRLRTRRGKGWEKSRVPFFPPSQSFPLPSGCLAYGQSITDGCLDWQTTERLLLEAAGAVDRSPSGKSPG
jgi:hypothetical protein